MIFQEYIGEELIGELNKLMVLSIIITYFIIADILYQQSREKPGIIKKFYNKLVYFAVFSGLGKCISLYSRIRFNAGVDYDFTSFLWYFSAIVSASGAFFLLYGVEKYIMNKQTKFLLSITLVLLYILGLSIGATGIEVTLGKYLIYIAALPSLSVPIIYFYLAGRTSGEIRKSSFFAGIGFILAFLGVIMDTLLGSIIVVGTLGDFYGNLLKIILAGSLLPIGFLIFHKSIKNISPTIRDIQSDIQNEQTIELIEKLGLNLQKPENLSEEDVKFYREQTVCLVCKTSLRGLIMTFICPECKALYCEKCAAALAQQENACWSCDGPIDKSKPQLKERVEEIDLIKEESHKSELKSKKIS